MTEVAKRQVAEARKTTRRRLRIVGSVIALGVAFLLYKTISSSVTYFKTVDQALASRATLGDSTFQIEGIVKPHSISRPNSTTVNFVIEGTRHDDISVTNFGEPPELFQASVPVVLLGHFVGPGNVFNSDQILVKHSNSYIAAHPKRVQSLNGKTVR
jgi:cytochrome c-type biogenesis protein CcmE